MATYVLVPGADGSAWYWHRVVPGLRARGHRVVTLDLPSHDTADLDDFADAIAAAVTSAVTSAGADPAEAGDSHGRPLVVVAQSLGGFSAPLVCARLPVDRLVLVNAMVPVPGETAGSGGATPARRRPVRGTRRRSAVARTRSSTCASTSSTTCRTT